MFTVTFECMNCNEKITDSSKDMGLQELLFNVNDNELLICSGMIKCHKCGETAPISIMITDESSVVVYEKIISPMSVKEKSNTINNDNVCFLCRGLGQLEVSKDNKIDTFDILECPLCNGKGYLTKE